MDLWKLGRAFAGIWTTFNGDRGIKSKPIPELAEEYGCGVGTIWRALQPKPKRHKRSE